MESVEPGLRAHEGAIGSGTPPRRGGRESTLRAVLLGLVLAAVLGAANLYLGLKVGMTVSASIPAAVVSMVLLRRVLRDGSVLEANQVQTAASAGESLAAGILFTVPALLLIGVWERFAFWPTTLIAVAGGWLGVLFMIPMRRVFIEESSELPYPEGVACASVLESGGASDGGAAKIAAGGLLGAIFKLAVGLLGWLRGSLEGALSLAAARPLFVGADLSPALVAVGYIVRLEVAAQIFLGGALGWWVLIPLAPDLVPIFAAESPELAPLVSADGVLTGGLGQASAGSGLSDLERAWALWSRAVRYVGVGAMAVGGLAALVRIRRGLARAVRELGAGWPRPGRPRPVSAPARIDLSAGAILTSAVVAGSLVFALYWRFTDDLGIALLATAIMSIAAFFFVGVASYVVGLVGNSNNPVSGMTITAVMLTGGMLWLFGYEGVDGMLATLGVAAVVCCAACTAGDVCNDLKTGALVGATPWRQQRVQLLGVLVAAVVMAPVLQLLHEAYGIGSRELAAPQASLFASLARGFFGGEALPWGLVGLGASIGLIALALDAVCERRALAWRFHLMPIAVGLYLPFGLALPILLGGVIEWVMRARSSVSDSGPDAGILFASGVVAGEALVGVAIAIAVALGYASGEADYPGSAIVTLVAALAALILFAFAARQSREPRDRN